MLTFTQFREQSSTTLNETVKNNVQKIGNIRISRIRIRAGKVQRRVKRSALKGYKLSHGRIKRMTSLEKRHRMMGAKRAKIKMRSKRSSINRKRKMSLRKRHSMGL
jgi:hypothetical protein